MQMSPEARAAAEELTARCEARFALMKLDPDEVGQHAAAVEAMLLEAERAGHCPRVLIWRLRQRLATLLRPPHDPAPARMPAHVF